VRHAAQKLKGLLGVERAEYSTDWLVTNRCRRCHGAGSWVCPDCGGVGVRGPLISAAPTTTSSKARK